MNRRLLAGGVVGVLVVIAMVLAFRTRVSATGAASRSVAAPDRPLPIDTSARSPEGVRVRVQVLNGSGRTGLARRATQLLRDHGYDVVDYKSRDDTTQVTEVQVTSKSRAWGERVAKALAHGRVREREGSLGYVDVVVLLGHDWQPSAQPLRP